MIELVGMPLQFLEELVRIDSGSTNVDGIHAVGEALIPRFEALGFDVQETAATGGAGRHLHFSRGPAGGTKLFLSAHLDTVFEEGSFHGFEVQEDIAVGPGVVDCKGGVVVLVETLRVLHERGELDRFDIHVVLNGDEETGSYTSRELIETVATGAAYSLVFEGARPSGAIVNWRRGNGVVRLRSVGKAAHSGVAHADGVNAIEELAHKLIAVQALTNYDKGVTLNVGTVSGGTKRNIVPDQASALVDIRFNDQASGDEVDAKIRALCAQPSVDGASTTMEGGLNRPPWPRDDAAVAKLTEHWLEVAAELGVELTATETGGGSDGNWTAALGVPTLDGLGPVGGKYHTRGEYVVVATIQERIELAATAIARL